MPTPSRLALAIGVVICVAAAAAVAQPPQRLPKPKPSVEKIGPTTFRLGPLVVDTEKRELTAPGSINDVVVLEFVANTKNGLKAYESAITIDTDAITFNAALLLIGCDPSRSRVPGQHFDPNPPKGDPLEMHVEWTANGSVRRGPVEQLLFDRRTNTSMTEAQWVYTGSAFIDMGNNQQLFMAEADGVLIGFVHSPSPLIENTGSGAVNGYGALVLNPNLGLSPGQAVTLTIRALPRP